MPFNLATYGYPARSGAPGNLHLRIDLGSSAGTFPVQVDAARDGGTSPFYALSRPGFSEIGTSPILGLIPAATTTAAPALQTFGQPELGHTLRMKATGLDPSGLAVLSFGASGSGTRQGCNIYVDLSTAGTVSAIATPFGEADFPVQIPVSTSLLFNEFYYQAATLPSDRLSNGLVLRIGGGL